MKIVINALAVDGGGGQTYLENLLPELDAQNGNQYWALLRKNHSVNLPKLSSKFKIVIFPIPRPYLIGRFFVEQFILPIWLLFKRADLLYSPADATTLFSPCPVVLAMRNPNLYARDPHLDWTFMYRLKFKVLGILAALSTKKARRIIVVSDASRKMITERIAIPAEKIKIVHHGASRIFFNGKSSNIHETILTGKTPYILSVSSIYRYKNYIRMVEAFHKVQNRLPRRYHLIIIGASFDNEYYRRLLETIRNLSLENSVHYIGGFRLTELPEFYQKASLFAFPSFLETFGHTLVEAMASKLPIAAADIPPTREIAGNAARYFDPFNINAIGDAFIETLTDTGLRKKLIEEGQRQVQRYSWENCAKATLQTFSEAAP